jgi:hypothetical protein
VSVRVLSIELPIRTVSLTNQREPWQAKHARNRAQLQALALALNPLGRPELPVAVTLTRIGPRTLDGDNLQSALKTLRDGVARWLKRDDADPAIAWIYRQEPSTLGQLRVFTRSGKMRRVADVRIRLEIDRP